jgi:outer membrane protein OmpA-like peptidoglycan-associated protein
MFRIYISFIFTFFIFNAFSQDKAIIFSENFANTSQWQANKSDASILLSDKQIELKSGSDETFFETTASVLDHQNYTINLKLKFESTDFGIVFKNQENKEHQIIKFTSEGILRADYSSKEKKYTSYKIAEYQKANSIVISKNNGTYSIQIGENKYSIELEKTNAFQIGIWVNAQKSITITNFDIKWTGKTISSYALFEGSEIIRKPLPTSVNSAAHEVKPTISEDGKTLYFTRKNSSGILLNDDSYITEYKQNQWTSAQKMTTSFNDLNHNVVSSIIKNGDEVFVLDQYAAGKKIKDTYRTVHLKGDKLGHSSKIKITDYQNTGSFISACMSIDGTIMILSLKNTSSIGGNDLYISFLKGKSWTKPENLGPNINTFGNEFSPFLSADNSKLYFSSNGWPGYGTQDIFVVERKGSWTSWSEPKNLGSKINDNFWDAYFTITKDESLALVCSNAGVNKGMDIYELRGERRDFTEPLVLKGNVYDSLTMKPLSNTTLTITDVRSYENKVLYQITTDENGYFETELSKDIDFDILVEKQFYNGQKDQIWYKDLNSNTVKRNYYLTPYKPGQKIVLEQIYFIQARDIVRDVSKPTIDKLYKILSDNPSIRILIEGHTDNQGDKVKNQKLSEERTIKIKEIMISMGIAEDRMEIIGYGSEKPIAPNDTEFNMRLNRRVDFLIIE